jgi:excisionase family DNA binding protein
VLSKRAQKQRLGLWVESNLVSPWDSRKARVAKRKSLQPLLHEQSLMDLGHWVASIGQTDDVVGQSRVLTLRLVGIKEVASYVGLSVHTMYAILSQRRIPYVKVGRLTKFDVRAIDAWIRKNSVMPVCP